MIAFIAPLLRIWRTNLRVSKSAIPTIDLTRRHGCSGPHRPPPSRSPHGYERCILPMDAKVKDLTLLGPMGVPSSRCTTGGDHIRALTARHPIKLTSMRCQSAWRPNPGRRSTYRCGKSVQTTGTTSYSESVEKDMNREV